MLGKRAIVWVGMALVLCQMSPAALASHSGRSSNDSDCWTSKATEDGFISRINEEREREGRPILIADPELGRVSRSHSQAMAAQDRLHHTGSRRLGEKVTNWMVLGENVGVGGDVDDLHEAFMRSGPHRENILYSDYRYIGVGVVEENDRMWVTITFEGTSNPGTTQGMPRC